MMLSLPQAATAWEGMASTDVREEETLKLSGRIAPPASGPDHELLPFCLGAEEDLF